MSQPRTTPLYSAHVERGAKMIDFAGWLMPIQYEGILAEHQAVRGDVGMFDVSHMGEVDFYGPGALAGVQRVITNDAAKLEDHRALYTVMCRENGGIVDDCIVYKFGSDHFRIVVNAANIAKDVAYFREHAGPLCTIEDRSDEFALIAVQGPKAVALVSNLIGAHLRDVPSFGLGGGTVLGAEITAARTGYTGEDGFELFVAANRALEVWNALAEAGATPIGLGARDTLRLEARLCLYGNDLTEQTDPYEAGLGWVVKLDKSDAFIGLEALRAIKAEGSKRKLVGFVVQSRGIVRPGAEVVDKGAVMGTVTSGGVAPTVGGSIGMAYVPSEMAAPETSIVLRQRNKVLQGRIVKGPFYRRASA